MMDCDTALTALLFGKVTDEVAAHLDACPRCAVEAPRVRRVTGLLDTIPAPSPSPALATHVLDAAAPLLSANAHRLPAAAWRRLAAAIAVAILPLPLILFVGWEALSTVNRLLSTVLPAGVSFYLVATHAVLLGLLVAVTYGAVPLLAAHQLRLRHEDTHA
jgi:hypothetical protein